ncbi:MAG: hypothetical protein ACLU0O_03425 [Collinsella sp.]
MIGCEKSSFRLNTLDANDFPSSRHTPSSAVRLPTISAKWWPRMARHLD